MKQGEAVLGVLVVLLTALCVFLVSMEYHRCLRYGNGTRAECVLAAFRR